MQRNQELCLCSDKAGSESEVTRVLLSGIAFRKAVLCTQTAQPSEHPLVSIRGYWVVREGVSVWSQLLISFILALYLEIARLLRWLDCIIIDLLSK